MSNICEDCVYYDFDEELDAWVCEADLDEDELGRFLSGDFSDCPYFRLDDEYGIVKKQM